MTIIAVPAHAIGLRMSEALVPVLFFRGSANGNLLYRSIVQSRTRRTTDSRTPLAAKASSVMPRS